MPSREEWNRRYRREGYVFGTRPNAWLAAQEHLLRPGMAALVPADGPGRNAVWLAGHGLDVLVVDMSEVALALARRLAAERGVRIRTERADLTEWAWPEAAFDLIASIYLQFPPAVRPRMHRAMLGALRPGGLIVLECFHFDQRDKNFTSGGPPTRDILVDAAILAGDFAGAEILELVETVVDLDQGTAHRGPGAVVRLLARKPGGPGLRPSPPDAP